jgi:protein ImuB
MAFASVFVPNFPLQAVVRNEPALRERAIALIEGNPPLCSVIAANEKAAQVGITIGMTKTDAEQFSGVEIRSRSLPQEAIAHAALLDIGWSVSPRLEDFSLDTIVLDLSGLESLFGSENEIASHLIERSAACGLRANVAIASNIDTALIVARGFAGVTVIPPDEEAHSLSSLPVRVLSSSEETLETLLRWGIVTCADLAALPALDLSERLGQEGVHLHALARGAISRSIVIAELAHFFEEEMELDDAVEELDPLSFVLGRLLDQLCARLNARALGAAAIRIRFELQPSFDAPASRDEIRTGKKQPGLYEKEIQLPIPARDSKMLLKLLRLRLQLNPPGAPVQKITLAADVARPRASQGGLFLPSFPDPEKLELTIARIAHVVGEGNVGSPSLTDTHRPGDFEMRRFLIPQESSKTNRRRKGARLAKKSGADAKIPMTLRIFRPAIPAKLDLESGRPTRVTFQGLHGEVVAASGPWLTSGDWWREAPRSSRRADATNQSFESDSRGATTVTASAAKENCSPVEGRSFSPDIKPRPLDGALAPEAPQKVTSKSDSSDSREATTVISPARSAAECREPKDKSPSPGGTIEGRNRTSRFLGGRSFSSDIKPRPLDGALAPEASPWHHDEWDLEIHFDCDLHDRNVSVSRLQPLGFSRSVTASKSNLDELSSRLPREQSRGAESRGLSSTSLADAGRSRGICSSPLNPVDASPSGHGFSRAVTSLAPNRLQPLRPGNSTSDSRGAATVTASAAKENCSPVEGRGFSPAVTAYSSSGVSTPDASSSRGAAIVISPARSAAKCREQKDGSPSPVGTIDSNGSHDERFSRRGRSSSIYRFFYDSLRRGWFVQGVYD